MHNWTKQQGLWARKVPSAQLLARGVGIDEGERGTAEDFVPGCFLLCFLSFFRVVQATLLHRLAWMVGQLRSAKQQGARVDVGA